MKIHPLLGFEFEGMSSIGLIDWKSRLEENQVALPSKLQYSVFNRGQIGVGQNLHASPFQFTIGKEMSYKAVEGSKDQYEVEFTTPAVPFIDAGTVSSWLIELAKGRCITSFQTAFHIHVSLGTLPKPGVHKREGDLPFNLTQIRNLAKVVLFCEEPFYQILRDLSPYAQSNRYNCLLRKCATLNDCYREVDKCHTIYAVYRLMNATIDNDDGFVTSDRHFLVNFERLTTFGDWEYRGHVGIFDIERAHWWSTIVARQSAFAMANSGDISPILMQTFHSLNGVGKLLGVTKELNAMYEVRHLRNGP